MVDSLIALNLPTTKIGDGPRVVHRPSRMIIWWTEDRRIAVLIGSLRSLRQLVSLTPVHPDHDLARQQIHGEHTQHGDSFEDDSSGMGDREDGSEGRADLDDLVPERTGEPDHRSERRIWSGFGYQIGPRSTSLFRGRGRLRGCGSGTLPPQRARRPRYQLNGALLL